jgi:hypothetical protein
MNEKPLRIPFFEDTSVGRLKKRIYDMSDDEIEDLLGEYEIPSLHPKHPKGRAGQTPSGKRCCYYPRGFQ